ncbi:MAG TPA: hypothetical protein VFE22_00435 [Edaphobacter sp.]|jgi:hypothetical protein|nr:hypothetical protein [Edaphobacter sp.]
MAYSESYTCDVCGKQKSEKDRWWLAWVDCFEGQSAAEDQPLLKVTRWQRSHAHSAGVKHLCGALCAGTLMDRWMSEQHENPEMHCDPVSVHSMPEQVTEIPRKAVGFSPVAARAPLSIEIKAGHPRGEE